eukprot:626179-Rhodomonas_salina.1
MKRECVLLLRAVYVSVRLCAATEDGVYGHSATESDVCVRVCSHRGRCACVRVQLQRAMCVCACAATDSDLVPQAGRFEFRHEYVDYWTMGGDLA